MMTNFEQLCALIPDSLRSTSGAVFNSGPLAFNSPSLLYVLGFNPGGAPEKHENETVQSHTQAVMGKEEGWAGFRDERWDGRAAGTAPLQQRVLYAFANIGIIAGRVPMSNVIFKRSRTERDLKEEQASLANLCWPFHEAAIRLMGVKVVLCFGGAAAELVREQLKARTEVDSYTENNRRRLTSRTFSNPNGIAVIKATHPSRFDWRNPNSDPTVLVKRALQRAA